MRKILVTGAAGYIGSVLVRQLLAKGYKVRGVDALFFGGESLISIYNNPNFEFIKGDLRNNLIINNSINGVTDVVHLAAIVGDPACAKQPDIATQINLETSKKLFDACNNKNEIGNFVFASTCSNYGKMEHEAYVTEESELRPVSLYSELKVEFEKYILKNEVRDSFVPTALRFATVYGLSPRMRFDLTVNEFMRDTTLNQKLEIYGEQFWRPYCHVEDLANSCVKVLEAPKDKIKQNVFNVGDTNENYQKKIIAEMIINIVPDVIVKYVHKDEDPRNYRVDFSKIKKELNFKITKTVPDGLKEIHNALLDGIISDPYSKHYKNI